MVFIIIVFMGVVSLGGVLLVTAISYGLFRWLGSAGAWTGVAVLAVGVGFMVYVMSDGVKSLSAHHDSERMAAQWMLWSLGVPALLGLFCIRQLWKLALSK